MAKCPYEYGKEYNVGDIITIAFSGKSAIVQILSVTEHWAWGQYDLEFSFGKPQTDLSKQLQLILKQIQKASNKTSSTDSVKWYTIPTDTAMPSGDVTYNTIGFIGNCASGGSTFKLYLDNEKTGAKTYHVYFKQLGGGKLTLTTGKAGATNLVMNSGTYVAIIYVDENGNITSQGATATSLIESGSTQPVTSGAVNTALGGKVNTSDIVDTVTSGNMNPVTSNAVAGALANKKNVQTAVNDPASDGQQYWDFIRSITQDTQGKITPLKSHLPYGWTTQAGIVTTYDTPAYDEDRSHVVNRLGLYNALYSGYYFDVSSTVTEKVAVLNSLTVNGCVKNNFVKLHISIVNLGIAVSGYDVLTVCKLPDSLKPVYDTARGFCLKQGTEGAWVADVLTNGYVRVWSWGTSGFAVYDNLEIIVDYPL